MQCGRCLYWDHANAPTEGLATSGAEAAYLGRCRRHAPGLPRHGLRAEWPTTSNTDWCGDFTQRGDDVL